MESLCLPESFIVNRKLQNKSRAVRSARTLICTILASILFTPLALSSPLSACEDAASDEEIINYMIDVNKQLKNKDSKFFFDALNNFLDSEPDMRRLAYGVVLIDQIGELQKTVDPLTLRLTAATALFAAETYGIGRADEWHQMYCKAVKEVPDFERAYIEFKKDTLAGDRLAVDILDSIEEQHPIKSALYARIYLQGDPAHMNYNYREFFYVHKDQYIDQGLNHLIIAEEAGISFDYMLTYFLGRRVKSCLSPTRSLALEKQGVNFGFGTSYLEKYDLIVSIAPECKTLLDKISYAHSLLVTNLEKNKKRAADVVDKESLGPYGRRVVDVLRGIGRMGDSRVNSVFPLCKLGRELLFKAAMSGDAQASELFLSLNSKNDRNFDKAVTLFSKVEERDKISSCYERDVGRDIELLSKLFEEGKTTIELELRFANTLYDSKRYTESGAVFLSIGKRAKESGNKKLLYSIYDVMMSAEKLKGTVFFNRVEALLD